MNNVILEGSVIREPELKQFNNGKQLFEFTLKTTEMAPDGSPYGTEWHRIKCWGIISDQAQELQIHDGDQVSVQGRIHNSFYERDGFRFNTTEITANTIQKT